MYSMKNVPQWASKKSDAVKKVAIEVFNRTLRETGSEDKARIASLAAMSNSEEEFKRRRQGVSKSNQHKEESVLVKLIKQKYKIT